MGAVQALGERLSRIDEYVTKCNFLSDKLYYDGYSGLRTTQSNEIMSVILTASVGDSNRLV